MNTITNEQLKEWDSIQYKLQKQYTEKDSIVNISNIDYIGSFYMYINREDETIGSVAFSVFDFKSMKCVYKRSKIISNQIPYITGYLAFREVVHFIELYNDLLKKHPEYSPDVILLNGYGKLHQKQAGCAVHFAHKINIPVIGIGKSLIIFDGLNEHEIRQKFKSSCENVGDYIEIIGDSGINYGAAVKTSKNSTNPLYVTIGSFISLEMAIDIVINCSKHRIPQPIRNSDILAKNTLHKYMNKKNDN